MSEMICPVCGAMTFNGCCALCGSIEYQKAKNEADKRKEKKEE